MIEDLWTDEVFRAGFRASWLGGLACLGAAAIPGWAGHDPVFALLVLVAVAPSVVLAHRPTRDRLLERFGLAVVYAWSAIILVAICAALVVVGDATHLVAAVYALPVLYFSSLYPRRAQAGLLAFLLVGYATAVALTADAVQWAGVILVVSVVGVTAYLSQVLSGLLLERERRSRRAELLAEQRANLLATVARAREHARAIDPHDTLEAVVDAAAELGMDFVALMEADDAAKAFRCTYGRGLPDWYEPVPHPQDLGLTGRVFREGRTITVENLAEHPEVPARFRDEGYQEGAAVPVVVDGHVQAVLVSAVRRQGSLTWAELEALELLGLHAGHAYAAAKRFEEERRAHLRLQETARLKDDFIATASHELRTPVTVLKAAHETLVARWSNLDEDLRREMLGQIQRHVASLERLVGQLTDFEDLRNEGYVARLRPLALRERVERAVARWRDERPQHVIAHDVAPGHRAVADPALVDRVLDVLVGNACTHTPAGTDIVVVSHATDDTIVVSVHDDGPGLPPEVLDGLDDVLRRGGDVNTRATRGLGLGLATAKAALSLLDAELRVVTGPEQGTTCSFALPRASSTSEPVASPTSSLSVG